MRIRGVLLASAAMLAFASSALAGRITLSDGVGGLNGTEGSGGAFTVTTVLPYNGESGGPGGSANSFSSFCVEFTEHVGFGGTYWTKIATGAVLGGISGGNPDPISEQTALLYSTFRAGASIAGFAPITTANTTANRDLTSSLQYAIWRLEGETDASYTGLDNSRTIKADATTMYNWAFANAQANNFYNVRVLQLWNDAAMTSSPAQDQLTLVPTPTSSLAGISLLGGLGLVGFMKKRRSDSSDLG